VQKVGEKSIQETLHCAVQLKLERLRALCMVPTGGTKGKKQMKNVEGKCVAVMGNKNTDDDDDDDDTKTELRSTRPSGGTSRNEVMTPIRRVTRCCCCVVVSVGRRTCPRSSTSRHSCACACGDAMNERDGKVARARVCVCVCVCVCVFARKQP
jgi:hypothetical protein